MITISCNRFDNTFEPADPDENFSQHIAAYKETLTGALPGSQIQAVMEYYREDYLNNGWTKEDVELYFNGLAEIVTDSLAVVIISDDPSNLTFSYRIEDTIAGIDTLIVEYTVSQEEGYLFIGNRQTDEETVESSVLVELFTNIWCPNCPYVETALHDLKQVYGNRFYYIEYHLEPNDPLAFGHEDIQNYYQLPLALPIGIVQGQMQISGGSAADSYDEYDFAVSQFFEQEAQFTFDEFAYTTNETMLSFNIKIETEVSGAENLQLRYALIEKVTDVTNAAGQPCRNVVIEKGALALTSGDLNVVLEEEFQLPDFTFTDPKLVFWVQTIEEPYNSETCLIHNVNEYDIAIP